jgi:hypothetical protein
LVDAVEELKTLLPKEEVKWKMFCYQH